jgi:hypothetical protein
VGNSVGSEVGFFVGETVGLFVGKGFWFLYSHIALSLMVMHATR